MRGNVSGNDTAMLWTTRSKKIHDDSIGSRRKLRLATLGPSFMSCIYLLSLSLTHIEEFARFANTQMWYRYKARCGVLRTEEKSANDDATTSILQIP